METSDLDDAPGKGIRQGFHLKSLYLRALGTHSRQPSNLHDRHDWESYFSLLADYERYLQPAELRSASRQVLASPGISDILELGEHVLPLADQYLEFFGAGGIIAVAFPVRLELRQQDAHRMHLEARLEDHLPPCRPFFEMLAGQLEALPTLIDYPAAAVTATFYGKGARFEIMLPSRPPLARLVRRMRQLLIPRRTAILVTNLFMEHTRLLRACSGEGAGATGRQAAPTSPVASSPNGMVKIHQHSATITEVDAAFASLLGYATGELAGQDIRRVVPSFQHPSIEEADPVTRMQVSAIHRNRTIIPIELRQLDDSDTENRTYTAHDLTATTRSRRERDQLASQLHAAQKMDTIGQLSSGIIHDFNNLLLAIRGQAEFATMEPGRRESALKSIIESTDRGAAITRRLLAFGRQEITRIERSDLAELIRYAATLMTHLLPRDVELIIDIREDRVFADVDPHQVEQVLINLMINARDAMPGGGHCTVSLDTEDENAIICIADTGCGMNDEVRARIFEPLFTTKPAGKGTGLGLAVVADMTNAMRGEIAVSSEPGRGTQFTIRLPVSAARPKRITSTAPAPCANTANLLVVEDNEKVRELTRMMLKGAGYEVVVASDGAQALALARESGPFDLAIVDAVLPGMAGREIAEKLADVSPATKVLYTSAYPPGARQTVFIVEQDLAFIAKPFGTGEIRDAVSRLLLEDRLEDGTASGTG